MGRRDALIECFGDTMRLCRSEELAGRVEASREETRLIGVSDAVDAPETVPSQSTVRVSVTPDRTFEAAQRLVAQSPDSRCAVLNFASPVNPGARRRWRGRPAGGRSPHMARTSRKGCVGVLSRRVDCFACDRPLRLLAAETRRGMCVVACRACVGHLFCMGGMLIFPLYDFSYSNVHLKCDTATRCVLAGTGAVGCRTAAFDTLRQPACRPWHASRARLLRRARVTGALPRHARLR